MVGLWMSLISKLISIYSMYSRWFFRLSLSRSGLDDILGYSISYPARRMTQSLSIRPPSHIPSKTGSSSAVPCRIHPGSIYTPHRSWRATLTELQHDGELLLPSIHHLASFSLPILSPPSSFIFSSFIFSSTSLSFLYKRTSTGSQTNPNRIFHCTVQYLLDSPSNRSIVLSK